MSSQPGFQVLEAHEAPATDADGGQLALPHNLPEGGVPEARDFGRLSDRERESDRGGCRA